MITVVINGTSFDYPEVGDTEWGDAATNAFKALAGSTLQNAVDISDPTATNEFTLLNTLDLGGNYGVKVLFISSRSSDPAQSGVFRLSNNELVAWRNGNNDGDNTVAFDNSDNFVINGNTISFDVNGEMLVNGVQVTRSGEIVNADVAAGAGIVESKLSLDYGTTALYNNIENHKADTANPHSVTKSQVLTGNLIVNTDVDNSAAIVESKLSLDYSTSSLNSAITSHTGDTNNPHDTTVSNLDDTTITTPANDDTLLYDGSKWVNTPNTVDNLKNVSITTIQDKQILSYDNNTTKWINSDNSISNLSDTTISSPASGQVLTYDGNDSKWKNLPSASASLTGLTDTNISTSPLPSNGDVLAYDSNTTMWVNSDSLTNHIGDTNNPHSTTIDNLDDTSITTISNNDTLIYDSDSSKWLNVENSIDNLSTSDIDSNTLTENDVLVYNDQTYKWENSQILVNHIGNTSNPHLTTVAKLTDTTISTPANNDVLLYDYANSQWVNSPIIEINDIANINTAVTDVTLTASDKRHQIFTNTDGFDVTLPSTGIKAGEKFHFTFDNSVDYFSNPFVFYSGANVVCKSYNGFFDYFLIALVDNPSLVSDWRLITRSNGSTLVKSGKFEDSFTINQYTTNRTSSTLYTLGIGYWDVNLSASLVNSDITVPSTTSWLTYLISNGNGTLVTYNTSRLGSAFRRYFPFGGDEANYNVGNVSTNQNEYEPICINKYVTISTITNVTCRMTTYQPSATTGSALFFARTYAKLIEPVTT